MVSKALFCGSDLGTLCPQVRALHKKTPDPAHWHVSANSVPVSHSGVLTELPRSCAVDCRRQCKEVPDVGILCGCVWHACVGAAAIVSAGSCGSQRSNPSVFLSRFNPFL